jgi:hypothetical protein
MSDPKPKKVNAHLWKKGGPSPNPKGRPPQSSHKTRVQTAFIDALERSETGQPGGKTYLESFLSGFMDDAKKPGSRSALFLADRLIGANTLDQLDAHLNRARRSDEAFQSFRFFRRLHDVQQHVFLSKMRMKVLNWGRRTGKTDYVTTQAAHDGVIKPDAQIIYFGLTFQRAIDLFFNPLEGLLRDEGETVDKIDRANGEVHLHGGGVIYISGAATSPDRNKWRGKKWDLAIVDECQNIKGLDELVLEILGPSLIDKNGTLILCGTGPKVRGTFWETLLSDAGRFKAYRSNANMGDNPFIPDHENVLARVREEHGYSETDPIYLREYLGQIAYDDDALVFRLSDANYFTDDEMINWIANQAPEDLRFSAGLDYGFTDSDAFSIVLYSETKNEKFLVWEYKAANTDVTTLAQAIGDGLAYVQNTPMFFPIHNRELKIFGDTSDQKIGQELRRRYGFPVTNALKQDKDFAVMMLQEEVRRGTFKVRRGGIFDQEALRIIFKRTEQDVLTREIDDDVFHPDAMDAILYSLRAYWLTHKVDHYVPTPQLVQNNPNGAYWEAQAARIEQRDQNLF